MIQVLVVADDLTGAADAGAAFARAGLTTAIALGPTARPHADVLAFSTKSREVSAAEAVNLVRAALYRGLGGPGGGASPWVYQKIDSALRGNSRAELLATMTSLGAASALVAPALPSQDRTTVGGRQFIDGVPVTTSTLGLPGGVDDVVALFRGDDGGPPVALLDLATVRAAPTALLRALTGATPGLVVADAECEADLRAITHAAIAGGIRLFAGSAGLARHLAEALPLTPSATPFFLNPSAGRPVLTAAGSRHLVTARQIAVAADSGMPIVRIDRQIIDDPAMIAGVAERVATHLAAGRHLILTSHRLDASELDGGAVAARLAAIAAAAAALEPVGGLVATGGDIAAAVYAALGVEVLWLRGEVRPAIPWGQIEGGALAGVPFATKAGSFGGADALVACINHLGGLTRSSA